LFNPTLLVLGLWSSGLSYWGISSSMMKEEAGFSETLIFMYQNTLWLIQ